MIKLSGVIITYNEQEHLRKCLSSLVDIVDEIIVVDSYSTDKTEEICKEFNVTFVQQKFLGYFEQKNFAVTQANHDYILSLDGDEALSDRLKTSILELKKIELEAARSNPKPLVQDAYFRTNIVSM